MTTANNELFRRAQAVLPGGVSSPVRAFKAVGGTPRVIVRAKGCRLEDAEGRSYIDYIGAWGPAIHGHAHAPILRAIRRAAASGTSFGTCSTGDVALAELIAERMPSVERVRFTNSGTEAVMTAVRIARAATGRELILKFDGCYHGHSDGMLVRAGSGPATFGLPDSPGVTREAAASTLVAGFNDVAAVEAAFRTHGERIAAIVVEPVAGNMGVVPPDDDFLPALRTICDRHGALLIFDEVMTGFRLAQGSAQQRYGIRADLSAFGKIIGGGLPVGAVGGPARLMELLAPIGAVYQGGTFSGNPVVMAAGRAALERLGPPAYERLERTSARLAAGLRRALADCGVRASVQRVGSMLSVFFGVDEVRCMDDVRRSDAPMFARFFHGMLDRGVHLPPSGFESWFVSLAHDDAAIDGTITAARAALDGIVNMDVSRTRPEMVPAAS